MFERLVHFGRPGLVERVGAVSEDGVVGEVHVQGADGEGELGTEELELGGRWRDRGHHWRGSDDGNNGVVEEGGGFDGSVVTGGGHGCCLSSVE